MTVIIEKHWHVLAAAAVRDGEAADVGGGAGAITLAEGPETT
jgi:hypothetical protein